MRTRNGVLVSVTNGDLSIDGHFTVPEGIISIARDAFKDATNLTSLRLSKELVNIDNNTLAYCSELKEIDMPNGQFRLDSNRLDCPNLERISISGDINDIGNGALSLIINHDLKEINFYFFDKEVSFKLNNRISNIFKVKDNRFILIEKAYKKDAVGAIIDESYVERFDYTKLCKMYNYESLESFLTDYDYPLDYRYDLVYEWGKQIEKMRERENYRNFFPAPEAIMAIPATKKDIYKYFLHQKQFSVFMHSHLAESNPETKILFTKMCYTLGAFEENNKDSFKFIENVLQNKRFCEIKYHFGSIDYDSLTYNPDFKDYLVNNWNDIVNNLNTDNYDILNTIFKSFNDCKRQAKKDKKTLDYNYVNAYMAKNRFDIRYGNEELFDVVKEYHAEYSRHDFDLMQDLLEKARQISLSETKKILTTVDNEKAEGSCYYKWLEGTDPTNFVLGNKVGCCARINRVGMGILRESVINPEVRNLALFGKKNKIIGKATAYFNEKKKYILFNNAEVSEDTSYEEKRELLEALLRAVRDQVALQNKDKVNVDTVAIGMTRNDLKKQIFDKRLKIVRAGLLKNNPEYSNDENLYEGDANSRFEGQCVLYSMGKKKGILF